jgi:hypothetical protein
MNHAQIAARILSQFTRPEHASSMVGDWMEEAGQRGMGWFWWCVIRTALAFLWRDFSTAPGQLSGLAIRGVLLNFTLELLCLGVFMVFVVALVAILAGLKMADFDILSGGKPAVAQLSGWLASVEGLTAGPVVNFIVGRWLARRAPGREMAACALFWMVSWAAGWFLAQLVVLIFAPKDLHATFSTYAATVLDTVALIMGAAMVRRRHAI